LAVTDWRLRRWRLWLLALSNAPRLKLFLPLFVEPPSGFTSPRPMSPDRTDEAGDGVQIGYHWHHGRAHPAAGGRQASPRKNGHP